MRGNKVKRDNKEVYESLPEGYLKKRKRWDLFYVWSLYVYCVFSVSNTKGILPIKKGTFVLLSVAIIGINVFTLMMSFTSKRLYNNIQIFNYGEIKVFTKMEVVLYGLPVMIVLPFIWKTMLFYYFFTGGVYLATRWINRPMDFFDKVNQRHY